MKRDNEEVETTLFLSIKQFNLLFNLLKHYCSHCCKSNPKKNCPNCEFRSLLIDMQERVTKEEYVDIDILEPPIFIEVK